MQAFKRLIGNRCSKTLGFAVWQLIKLDRNGKRDTFMYRYWNRVAVLLLIPSRKWSDGYTRLREGSQP